MEHYKEINARYKISANQDEKIARKILEAEIRRLEKIAFPSRIERFIRKTIENTRMILEKVLQNGRSKRQVETDNEIGNGQKPVDISNGKKSLNKTAIQYTRKLKAVTDDTLLPKLRRGNTKGLKM